MCKSKKKNSKGMTLLEIIIVLGIMGVIAAGVVIIAQRAIDNQSIQKLTSQLNTVQTGMIQVYRSRTSYPAVESNLVESEKLSDALIAMGKVTKQDLQNPFTGMPLNIFTMSLNKIKNRAFAIRVSELSQDQCTALITNIEDQFSFIQVSTTGASSLTPDAWVNATANSSLGVLKSPNGQGIQLNIEDLDHVKALCGGAVGSNNYYDVYFGNR